MTPTIATAPSASLADIAAKVEAGQRLSYDDGVRLYAARDLFEIGRLANLVRERLHGDATYYNVNRHINYSNYCVLRCNFCSFYRAYDPATAKRQNVETSKRQNEDAAEDQLEVRSQRRAASAVGVENANRPFSRDAQRPASPARGSLALPVMSDTTPGGANALGNGEHRHHSQGCETQADAPRSLMVDSAVVSSNDAAGAYELSIDDIVARAAEAYAAGATEVHIVGGLHPKLPFEFYLDLCRAIRAACPRIHIKAFTAIEIIHFTRIARPRLSIRAVLERLRDAGLGSLPGGGAEIFDDRVHDEAYRNKVGEEGWFDVHRAAHEIGMYTNATMLYGHIERPEERIGHMIKLREHQDESLRSRQAAFNCFIPLSFIPDGSALGHLPGPTGVDDLKTLAISRLMLDNVPHIKAFWIMQSAKLAQVSLNWGVDDVDGTVVYYDITKREGGAGSTHQEMTIDRMQCLIREAGREPVERDTLYRRVERSGLNWRLAE